MKSVFNHTSTWILEDYLNRLRNKLRILPRSERDEIINEIRTDIELELNQKSLPDCVCDTDILTAILNEFGSPEDAADEILSQGPFSSGKGTFKRVILLAAKSLPIAVLGMITSIIAFIIYFYALLNLAMAGLKVFWPQKIGLFVSDSGGFSYGIRLASMDFGFDTGFSGPAREVLGYWAIPIGIILGLLLLMIGHWFYFHVPRRLHQSWNL